MPENINKMENKKTQNARKGKTYEEMYGLEKSKAYKQKLSFAFKGKKYSEEKKKIYQQTQARISKGKTIEERFGIERAKEIRAKISHRTKEVLNKPEVREKMSAWQRGRIMPQAVVQKRIDTIKRNGGFKQSDYQKKKASIAVKKARKLQIFPIKDTAIEVKMQNYLKQLGVEFYTHQWIDIEHGYQCDILIPSKKLVIECDGDYWHGYWSYGNNLSKDQKEQRKEDLIRTNEMRDKGYKVLRFWETEIKLMELQDLKTKLNQMGVI